MFDELNKIDIMNVKIFFFAQRPFIYNVKSAKRWVGGVRKMAIFADFQY